MQSFAFTAKGHLLSITTVVPGHLGPVQSWKSQKFPSLLWAEGGSGEVWSQGFSSKPSTRGRAPRGCAWQGGLPSSEVERRKQFHGRLFWLGLFLRFWGQGGSVLLPVKCLHSSPNPAPLSRAVPELDVTHPLPQASFRLHRILKNEEINQKLTSNLHQAMRERYRQSKLLRNSGFLLSL